LDDKDLIYEGIATVKNLTAFISNSVSPDDKDLIYEGIATFLFSFSFSLRF